MKVIFPSDLEEVLRGRHGSSYRAELKAVSGGCINKTQRLLIENESYFFKSGPANKLEMFRGEERGLLELKQAKAFRIPKVISCGVGEDQSWLLLEWLDMDAHFDMKKAGRLLALQHKVVGEGFGFSTSNHIGSTPQRNTFESDWVTFYGQHRMLALGRLGQNRGLRFNYLSDLIDRLPDFFGSRQVSASLLHGDLWSGNMSGLKEAGVTIYDPAVHYGDRECDLAMTELFGGFSPSFYQSYHEAFPLDQGYELRKGLYQLYHIMNHALLFGGSYVNQSQRLIESLLRGI